MKPQEDYNVLVELLRDEEYPTLKGQVYLDHAGTTPYPKSLVERFSRDLTQNLFGNPHSASPSSQRSTALVEDTRLRALQFFNADPAEFDLIFVANATAGIKLVAEAFRSLPGGFSFAYHQASHTSVVGVREEARHSVCLEDSDVRRWTAGEPPFGGGVEASCDAVLFAYPGQSNMDGTRYPLSWADDVRLGSNNSRSAPAYTLLDSAALASTSPLDLSEASTAPDFVVVSFYKIFGFPDLGALLVRRDAESVFDHRKYFGGGTVDTVVCMKEQWHAPKSQSLHDRLEDGTLPVHSIVALHAAMDVHGQLFGSMSRVASHTSFLCDRLYRGLSSLRHGNGSLVCTMYSSRNGGRDGKPESSSGPIMAFNIRSSQGAWISLTEFERLAGLKSFHVRTGGVCNPGGIASALGLGPWEIKNNFSAGFRCGREEDIMAGKPTGVIRASLGAMSTIDDVDQFLAFIEEFYRDASLPSPSSSLSTTQTAASAGLYVHSLTVYPIKSCGGYSVPAGVDWEVRPEGLAWDREWCLIHRGSGQALSQKRHPTMALLRPSLDFDQGVLTVSYWAPTSNAPPKNISIPLSNDPTLFRALGTQRVTKTRVCGEEITAQAYVSPYINSFFSDILGVPCFLARFPSGGQGRSMRHSKAHLQQHQIAAAMDVAPESVQPAVFPLGAPPSPPDSDSESARRRILLSNESPILTVSLSSLDVLNSEIKTRRGDGSAVAVDVFRANVVLGSLAVDPEEKQTDAYAEDTWSSLVIGQQKFAMLGSCRRCHMVCVNQQTAEKSEEPFVALTKTRRFNGKVFFGTHMAHVPTKQDPTKASQYPTIRTGDYAWAAL